jgi:cell division protein FtsW (lipid II flippase)
MKNLIKYSFGALIIFTCTIPILYLTGVSHDAITFLFISILLVLVAALIAQYALKMFLSGFVILLGVAVFLSIFVTDKKEKEKKEMLERLDARWKASGSTNFSSYSEYKFVTRARQELGWEASLRGDELLKRAYNTENPERMLQALKEAQFNLNRSINRATEGR